MTKGAVAAGHTLTVEAAAGVLADGGNAFDAVISGLWMACVCEPVLASPGGGGFVMAHDGATGATTLYDFFAVTPRRKRPESDIEFHAIHADFGPVTQEFHIGHGASAAPGYVPGLYAVHGDLGRLPMSRLIEPAINASRSGIAMTPFQAFLSEVVRPILDATSSSRALFSPRGKLLATGDTYANPELGDFFTRLGEGGLAFYRDVAVPALSADQSGSGHLREEDFLNYAVARRTPLEVDFSGQTVFLNPPPSLGGAFIARALQAYSEAGGAGTSTLASALASAEAARIEHNGDAAAMLAGIGIDLIPVPTGGSAQRGTTHISVIDGDGNAAAATVSNGEGNGHIAGGFGFMLNNMLGEEDLNPAGFHAWRKGERLASNMAPTVMTGGDTLLALGSGGSNRIRSAMFLSLARAAAGNGASLQQLVSAPRLHFERGHLDFEAQFETDDIEGLKRDFADHRAWAEPNLFFGGVHAVQRGADGTMDAAGDRRRGGHHAVIE